MNKSLITKTKSLLIAATSLLSITCCLLFPDKTSAQNVDLGIYPPILEIMIKPGKSITQVYKLTNYGDPVIVSSSVAPFIGNGETGNVSLIDCNKIEIISCESLSWYSFQNADLELEKSFFLGSGRTQEVVLKISVPDYASEGDYYNSLVFTTQAPLSDGEKKSRATAAIASNILITVSEGGNPTRNIDIVEFSAKRQFSFLGFKISLPFFDSFDRIPVSLRIKNNGSAYTSVSGKITLNGFPGLQADYPLPSQNILTNSIRLLTASPSAQLSKPAETLLLPQGFYLGRYALEAEVKNANDTVKNAKISFFALPVKVVFVALFVITLVIGVKHFRKTKLD